MLGMPLGTAERKLRKLIIHEFATQLGRNVCFDCGTLISDPEDLAVFHVEDWQEVPARYFDMSNIAFSHTSCRTGRNDLRQGDRTMKRIETIVENSKGQPLLGSLRKGQIYVGGEKDQQYQVRVRNLSYQRICVVVTVDGRNVNTGEPGSWEGSGMVLGPREEHVFKGWRTSNDEVAAFRLGAKEDSYSAQSGTPENVGVIGVAVFDEKVRPATFTITHVYPQSNPWHVDPWGAQRRGMPWLGTEGGTGGYVPTQPTVTYSGGSGTFGASVQSCVTNDAVPLSYKGPNRGGILRSVQTQQLGTEFGEALADKVTNTTFDRATSSPAEVMTIRYDSVDNLRRQGLLPLEKPMQEPKKPAQPQAFPQSAPAFCPEPAKSRWR